MAQPRPTEIPLRSDGIQLDESRSLQAAVWKVQRLVWVISAIIIVLAIAGLTGRGGPFAVQTASGAFGSIELPRITRRGATDAVVIDLAKPLAEHRLVLSSNLPLRFEIQTISPRPIQESVTKGGMRLVMAGDGAAPHPVVLHLRAREFGVTKVQMVLDGVPLSFSILTLP